MVLYLFYLRLTLHGGPAIEPEFLGDLHFGILLDKLALIVPILDTKAPRRSNPSTLLVISQTLFALGFIILGAGRVGERDSLDAVDLGFAHLFLPSVVGKLLGWFLVIVSRRQYAVDRT